jgi:uncharacterized protein
MRLDLSHIRQSETAFLRQYEPPAFAGNDEDYRVVSPVSLAFTAYKDHDRFRLVGTVTTAFELGCSRCLEPFTLPVDAAFDLRYLPKGGALEPRDGDDERETNEDDVSSSFYEGEEIDLAALLREQFYLALPMKPLCRPDCRGLCPQCGTNLNVDTCQCRPQWGDPRLAGLKALVPERKHDDA